MRGTTSWNCDAKSRLVSATGRFLDDDDDGSDGDDSGDDLDVAAPARASAARRVGISITVFVVDIEFGAVESWLVARRTSNKLCKFRSRYFHRCFCVTVKFEFWILIMLLHSTHCRSHTLASFELCRKGHTRFPGPRDLPRSSSRIAIVDGSKIGRWMMRTASSRCCPTLSFRMQECKTPKGMVDSKTPKWRFPEPRDFPRSRWSLR
jgi:hypothetical protein